MMVTISNGDSFLQPLLSGSTSNKLDNVKIYTTIVGHLQDAESTEHISEELQSQSGEVTAKLCKDVESDNNELAMAALQVLGLCLHSEQVVKAFQETDLIRAIQCTCRVVKETADKATCTRALWCLASEVMPAKVLKDEVEPILSAIECALLTKNFKSMTVEHEGLNAIIRLLEHIPEEMKPHTGRWAKLVYPLLLHGATKIRERAVVAMDLGMSLIREKPSDVARSLMADLKNKDKTQSLLLEQLTRLMGVKQEIFALKVWEYYVTILGKLLHHGQLINQLLPFVEQGFKNPAPEVKCAAYSGWKTLIDNFALNPDIVSDGKRVKLVMQVFKLSNAKVESVAMEKLSAWYFFLRKLGTKAGPYFDTVAVPLLNYCVGGVSAKSLVPGSGSRTPTASRLGMISSPATPNIPGSPMPQFRRLQLGGAQVLGRILGSQIDDPSAPKAKFTIDPLDEDLIAGPAFFVKHSMVLITAVRECITNLQGDLEDGLLHHIWYCLVAHVKNVLDHTNKKDAAEVLSAFLTCLQHLVTSQALSPEKLLKLLQAVLVLPAKALASPSYAIGTSQTGMMQGTPVLFLLDLLFNHRLLETSSDHERFYTLLEKLILCGMTNQSGALNFTKAVLQLVDQAAPKLDEREAVWRMWSLAINPLLEHVLKTNEVNAGDALEHDFSCMYAALQLPLLHLLSSEFSQQALKSMLRTWTETYTTFARLAALVTNAEANVCCEELSSRIVAMIDNNRDKLKDMACVETLTAVCQVMVGQIDFSGVKGGNQFTSSGLLSPGKFMTKKKQRPLGNLHSFIKLIVSVSEGLHQAADGTSQDAKQTPGPSLQIAALAVIDVLSELFTHVPTTTVIAVMLEKLAPSLAQFFEGSARKPSNRMYSPQVLQKLEKLWLDVVTCMQSRYQGVYDSDFLAHVSPLLEATFLHPRRPIKNQTNILWNATFSHANHLTYPASLKSVLAKVKEKTPISLPGWDATEIMMVEETPLSQMSQGAESQVPLPNIVGLPSPHKAVGSFLNKVASPDVKKSPLKRGKSPAVGGVRKKLGLDDMSSQDFVVITPTTRRTRVLTEHQREVRHERKALPAMYNNLDASQDRSMMSQGGNSMDTPSADTSQIPFSFSAANKTTESESSSDKKPEEPEAAFKDPEPPSKEELEKKVKRRRSVTFGPSPVKTKRGSKEEPEDEPESVDDESTSPVIKEPKVLFGQPVTTTKVSDTETNPEEPQDSDMVECVADTEMTELTPKVDIDPSPSNVLQSESEASEAAKDSQDSETLLKAKPKAGRGRRSRSLVASEQSLNSDSESSGQEGKGGGAGRKSPRKQSPRKQPAKKAKVEGMKKLENWFNPSPKKSVSAPVLVEDSQHFSPSKMDPLEAAGLSPVPSTEAVVEETPSKDEQLKDPEKDVTKATKQLFGRKVLVPDSEVVEPESQFVQTSTQSVIPDSEIPEDRLNPVVQLSRLTASDLRRLSPKKESSTMSSVVTSIVSSVDNSSDDSIRKVTESTGTTVVKKVRRRSSIKYSKASQEKASPLSPINMDDIIPSSQDCFGIDNQKSDNHSVFKNRQSSSKGDSEKEADSVIVISQTEKETDVEKMDVDLDETVDPRAAGPETTKEEKKLDSDTAPVIVDMKKDSTDSGGNAIENPDIIPADLSSRDEDSQATIVPAKKRGRPKKLKKGDEPDSADSSLLSVSTLDSSFELSQESTKARGRPHRRRSMPNKFKDTESILTPEKTKKSKSEKELKLRPGETMAEVQREESEDIVSSQESIINSQESIVNSENSEKTGKKKGKKKSVEKTTESEELVLSQDSVVEDTEKPVKKRVKKKAVDKVAEPEEIVSSQESVVDLDNSETPVKKRGRKKAVDKTAEPDEIISSQESLVDLDDSEKKEKKRGRKKVVDKKTEELASSQESVTESPVTEKKGKKGVKKSLKDTNTDTEVIIASQETKANLPGSVKKGKKAIVKEMKPSEQIAALQKIVSSLESKDSEVKGKKPLKKKVSKGDVEIKDDNESQQTDKRKKKQLDDSPAVTKKGIQFKAAGRKSVTKAEGESQAVDQSKSLEKVVSKDCNLDVATDSEDDIPISLLSKSQKKKVQEKSQENSAMDVADGNSGDDVPLTLYKTKSSDTTTTSKAEIKYLEPDNKPHKEHIEDDVMSVEDIFDASARTSTPSKVTLKAKARRSSGILSNLAIDMKTTSPVNKRLRSKGSLKLNRSMSSMQKRRRSPGSPFNRKGRSKSVSPSQRLKRVNKEPVVVVIEDSQDKEIELMKGTELSSSEGSEVVPESEPSQVEEASAPDVEASTSEAAVVTPSEVDPKEYLLLKDIKGSPRRSPRKLQKEESPQKSCLSPTRRPVTQSLEMPETPTSATKHQSRASLILERSRLFAAPRSSSVFEKKKFTTLKPAAADTVIEDLISPSKSILKQPAAVAEASGSGDASTDVKASPPPPTRPAGSESSPSFRPIQIPRIYSPSASPSAGILKKRKLSGDMPTDSPSPPNKLRRVSFNEAVDVCQLSGKDSTRPVNRCLDMPAKALRTMSPLVASSSKVTANQSKFVTSQNSENSETEKGATCFAMPHPVNKKKEVDPSPNSIRSTAESQLNCQDPIFPELQSCTEPIDQVLAQLTSSTWIRGLGQLIRSKNIRTIGDLCALTEYEVNNLPIRTPKVATVKQVLEAYSAQLEQRKPKPTPAAAKEEDQEEGQEEGQEEVEKKEQEEEVEQEKEAEVAMEEEDSKSEDTSKTLESPSKEPLPSVEEALAMSPIREADTSMESMSEMHLDLKTDESLSTTGTKSADPSAAEDSAAATEPEPTEHEYHFRDPLSSLGSAESLTPSVEPEKPTQLSASVPLGQVQSKTTKTPGSASGERSWPRSLLRDMEAMAQRLTPDVLTELPANYLVAMHMHLNTMMTNVIVAQSNQCPLSLTSSQMSETEPE